MYGYDFPNAITTFKYVNTTGEDENAKHSINIDNETWEWAGPYFQTIK